MKFRRDELSILILVAVLLAFLSGVASAGEDVEETDDSQFGYVNATLAPDAKYADAGGSVVTVDDYSASSVELRCFDEDNDFVFYCETDNPNSVKVRSESSTVEQSGKDNDPVVGIKGTVATLEDTDVVCSCDKSEHKGKARTKDFGRMTLKCDFKKCDCASDLTDEQNAAVAACIAGSETKTANIELRKDGRLDGKLRGEGRMGAPPES